MTTRVSTRVTTAMLRGLQRLGADPDELCRDIGADPEALRAADSRVSVAVLARLWLSAERMLRDPMIGLHTAEAIGPTGLFHYLTMTQSTVGRGIASLISSTRLASDNLVMTLDRAPATTVIGVHFSFRSGPGVAQSAEYVCGLLASHLYLTTGGRLVPDRVDFTHRARGPEAEYRRIMRSQVRFDASKGPTRGWRSPRRRSTGRSAPTTRKSPVFSPTRRNGTWPRSTRGIWRPGSGRMRRGQPRDEPQNSATKAARRGDELPESSRQRPA
jgi:hypothetical protein